MSISLKNHEDRIAALEKQTQTPKAVFVTPDYGKAESVNFSSGTYNVNRNGFMSFDLLRDGNGCYVRVNGVTLHSGYDAHSTEVDYSAVIPVKAGDTVTWNHDIYAGRTGIKFIPYRLTIL